MPEMLFLPSLRASGRWPFLQRLDDEFFAGDRFGNEVSRCQVSKGCTANTFTDVFIAFRDNWKDNEFSAKQ